MDKKKSPALVFIFSVITLGLYLIYWYWKFYKELETLSGKTPTGNSYLFDFLLSIITCGIWGIYMDYRISLHLDEMLVARGKEPQQTATLCLALDIASYFTIFITYIATSAIQQGILNDIYDAEGQS